MINQPDGSIHRTPWHINYTIYTLHLYRQGTQGGWEMASLAPPHQVPFRHLPPCPVGSAALNVPPSIYAVPQSPQRSPVLETVSIESSCYIKHCPSVTTAFEIRPSMHSCCLHSYGMHSYGLHSHGLHSYGMHSYGMHSYGMHSYGIHSYGMHSYGMPRSHTCQRTRVHEPFLLCSCLSPQLILVRT